MLLVFLANFWPEWHRVHDIFGGLFEDASSKIYSHPIIFCQPFLSCGGAWTIPIANRWCSCHDLPQRGRPLHFSLTKNPTTNQRHQVVKRYKALYMYNVYIMFWKIQPTSYHNFEMFESVTPPLLSSNPKASCVPPWPTWANGWMTLRPWREGICFMAKISFTKIFCCVKSQKSTVR